MMFMWPDSAVKWHEVEMNEPTIGAEELQCKLVNWFLPEDFQSRQIPIGIS